METVSCVGLIPAEQTVDAKSGLNVLVLAVNRADRERRCRIRIFGGLTDEMRALTARDCVLAPGEHAHLYFHIDAGCFLPEFWGGEVPEEMTLCAGTDAPQTAPQLVFIEM